MKRRGFHVQPRKTRIPFPPPRDRDRGIASRDFAGAERVVSCTFPPFYAAAHVAGVHVHDEQQPIAMCESLLSRRGLRYSRAPSAMQITFVCSDRSLGSIYLFICSACSYASSCRRTSNHSATKFCRKNSLNFLFHCRSSLADLRRAFQCTAEILFFINLIFTLISLTLSRYLFNTCVLNKRTVLISFRLVLEEDFRCKLE